MAWTADRHNLGESVCAPGACWANFENTPNPVFANFSPSKTRASCRSPFVTAPRRYVQPRCISLQNFAQNEIVDRLRSPMAHQGCRFDCTTSGFAQKKDTKPVGGRGISAFSDVFLLAGQIFRRSPSTAPLLAYPRHDAPGGSRGRRAGAVKIRLRRCGVTLKYIRRPSA